MAKTIEETYQKKTQKEHILLRPDTYIGSIEKDTQMLYVWDEQDKKIVSKSISYVPGLYKIFDEILVNAADNKMRDPKMNKLMVQISKVTGTISIYNNGKGIPIEIHSKEKVYVPELIFGHLLTGSNYDDNEKKVTGGRNGYGAKLCNIFSTEFIVETADSKRNKKYLQVFKDNMNTIGTPEITGYKGEEYTKITFKPDLRRFGMDELDDEVISLLRKRVYDMCATLKNVKVYLDGELLEIKNFKEYVKLYVSEDQKIIHTIVNDRWELAFAVADEQFSQVSFVNSISTSKGGTHVAHVIDQLVEPIMEEIKKKNKGLDVKPLHIKNNIFIFINCLIENPAFDSQTKENLTLKVSSFGSKCNKVDSFIKDIIKNTNIMEKIVSFSRAKQSAQLKKTDGAKTTRLSGIPKLEDANLAGTKRSAECTLILTEGDSAKTLAVSGLAVVGRDLYGVFPLRGKLLNVREASHKQIMENAEISNIKRILGLQHGKVYEDTKTLRYGHIMIMTDQDHDGSHIKGLIINFLDHFFPSLLKIPNFLLEFITPIIRATKKGVTRDFFTIQEYDNFKVDNEGWSIKYYKGLGTSTSADAKQYFSNLPKHVKNFHTVEEVDRNLISLAFSKKKADDRKAWLADFVPGTFLDQSVENISISDFINKELILFSMADNVRSIPSVMDGLKPGQRKVLFCCFKRNLKAEIKVAQLVGYVSEHSAYHHGEQSLSQTIVNLAQNFVGSNNINLLMPLGSFGTRLQGGKDAASSRYIFTNLSPLTRLIFREHDDPILNYLEEDNMKIEPEYYAPIIPMVLINGADGIGTGWSTNIPNYNPLEIIANIKRLMKNQEMEEMSPYYRNFKGEIKISGEGKYVVSGISNSLNENNVEIVELPIGTWTQTYKEYLESLAQEGTVRDYKAYHTDKSVHFIVTYTSKFALKLTTSISTSNMVCFDTEGRIKKYNSPLEIIKEFYFTRLKFYTIRKESQLKTLKDDLNKLENKVRFIKDVTEDRLVISKRSNELIIKDLDRMGYDRLDNFEYLLGMKISSLTKERIEKLGKECEDKKKEYQVLTSKSIYDLWNEDLAAFEAEYQKFVAAESAEYESETSKKIKRPKLSTVPKKASKETNSKSSSKANSKNSKPEEVKKPKLASKRRASEPKEPSKKTKTVESVVKNDNTLKDLGMIIDSSSSEQDNPWDKYRD